MRTLIAAALIAVSTSACSHERNEDPGPVTSRNFTVGNFTEVEVAGPFDVDVRTGANPSVSARGNQALLDKLEVEVKGDKLLIRTKNEHHWFGGWHNSRGSADLAITVPSLRAATLAGSGDLVVDKVAGDSFEGQIAGSGNLRLGSVAVQDLKIGIAGAGDANVGTGQARSAKYEIAGSGDVDAAGIRSEDVKVSIAGSGGVKAVASGSANVDIVGSGDVEVTGGAKCKVKKAGSGNVRCS